MGKKFKRTFLALMMSAMLASSMCVVPAFAETGEGGTGIVYDASTLTATVSTEAGLLTALSGQAETVILSDNIVLNNKLVINRKVVIDGANQYSITASDTLSDYVINVENVTATANEATVTFKDIVLKAGNNSKSLLNLYCSTGIWLDNVVLDRSCDDIIKGGAPLIINSSKVQVRNALTIKGIDKMLDGGKAATWYGINIDCKYSDASLDLTNATEFEATGIKTLIYCSAEAGNPENPVLGVPSFYDPNGLTGLVYSETLKQCVKPVAEVGTTKYGTFSEALANVTEGSTVTLLDNISVDSSVSISADNVTLDGANKYSITGTPSSSYNDYKDNLVNVTGNGVKIQNITLTTGLNNRNVLSVSGATNVTLENVILDHTSAQKGAPLIVGGSTVTVNGKLTLKTSANSWYGINVDTQASGQTFNTSLTFADGSSLDFDETKPIAIGFDHFDSKEAAEAALINPKNANVEYNGYVVDGNNTQYQYVLHTHSYSDAWTNDTLNHWHECAYEGAKNEIAAHTYSAWDVTKEATYTETGLAVHTCTICGYQETMTLPMLEYIEIPIDTTPVTPSKPDGWSETRKDTVYYEDGKKVTGMKEIDGETYIFDEKGRMQTGWVETDNGVYYLDEETGAMQTGWVKDDDTWYYMSEDNGAMETGWVKDGNSWYYLDEDNGAMATGWVKDGGTWYYLNEDHGAMVSNNWIKDTDGSWYYFRGNGAMVTNGWVQWKGEWYYCGADGKMLKGTTTPDGYRVDSNGKWIK